MSETRTATIKFDQSTRQELGAIAKVVGLVKAKSLIQLIDQIDLEANPRSSKTGAVTNSIQESIESDQLTFPFKTKGILLAASEYTLLDRDRYNLRFGDLQTEGILDGGHNMLAIGLYIMKEALEFAGLDAPRRAFAWADFKGAWAENREVIEQYREHMRVLRPQDAGDDGLDFYVPVELLIPSDLDDPVTVDEFKSTLLDICSARNNNVQLSVSAKANQKGYFEPLKALMERIDPSLAERVEWKTNDGGEIRVDDIVALSWIPLALIDPVTDQAGRLVEPPAPSKLYSGKGDCMKRFERLMGSSEVTVSPSGSYRRDEVKSAVVQSAFEIAVQLPALYDVIFEQFPGLYNAAGGSFGRITAVKTLNQRKKIRVTPFAKRPITADLSPDGFIYPLVFGLTALLEVSDQGDSKRVVWKTDPKEFLEEKLDGVVRRYSNVLAPWGYDPQKVGKAPQSYSVARDAFTMALAGLD